MFIREYNPQTHDQALEVCFSDLQEFSRAHDGRILDADCVKEPFLTEMQLRCDEHDGIVFVAEMDAAPSLNFVTAPPGNDLKEYDGAWYVRINDQWRLTFKWGSSGPYDVLIEAPH